MNNRQFRDSLRIIHIPSRFDFSRKKSTEFPSFKGQSYLTRYIELDFSFSISKLTSSDRGEIVNLRKVFKEDFFEDIFTVIVPDYVQIGEKRASVVQ